MQTIPSINCSDFACVAHKFLEVKKFLPEEGWLHIDVADAKFTYNKSWGDPEGLRKLLENHPEFSFNVEVHLMVEEPELVVEDWFKVGVQRVIVHLETILDKRFRKGDKDPLDTINEILGLAKRYGAEVMLSTNPETRLENATEFLEKFNSFQVLAVRPGPAGQIFLPIAYEKVRFLRERFPDAKIEVDGGVNLETATLSKEAGADMVVVASYIYNSSNPRNAYTKLSVV